MPRYLSITSLQTVYSQPSDHHEVQRKKKDLSHIRGAFEDVSLNDESDDSREHGSEISTEHYREYSGNLTRRSSRDHSREFSNDSFGELSRDGSRGSLNDSFGLSPKKSSNGFEKFHSYKDTPSVCVQTSETYAIYSLQTEPLKFGYNQSSITLPNENSIMLCPVFHSHKSDKSEKDVKLTSNSKPSAPQHYFVVNVNDRNSAKEMVEGKWVSEIMESSPILSMKSFYICKRLDEHSSETNRIFDQGKIVVAIIRLECEIAIWLKIQRMWICFARYNCPAVESFTPTSEVLWESGQRKFTFDAIVWNHTLVVSYAAQRKDYELSTPMNGLVGITKFNMIDVIKDVLNAIEKSRSENRFIKSAIVTPASHFIHPFHESSIQFLRLSNNGCLLATASTGGTIIRIVETESNQVILTLRRGTTLSFIHCLAFSPSNRYLCCTSSTSTLHVFDLQQNMEQSKQSESSWFSLKSWMEKSHYSKFQYQGLSGNEKVCYMPSENCILVLNSDGELFQLNINGDKLEVVNRMRL